MTGAQVIAQLRKLGVEDGARRIAGRCGVSLESIVSNHRYKPATVARARTQVIACVTWSLGLSTPEAARLFGLADHTSILHHLRKREAEIQP